MHKPTANLSPAKAQLATGKGLLVPRQPFYHDGLLKKTRLPFNDTTDPLLTSPSKPRQGWSAAAISERLVLPEQLIAENKPISQQVLTATELLDQQALDQHHNNIKVYRKRPQLSGLVPADPVPYGTTQAFSDAVIVVEGQRDLEALRTAVNCSVFILGGGGNFHPYHPTLHALWAVDRMHQHIIVFTDPDPAGRLMRQCMDAQLGPLMHAFLPAHLALLRTRKGHKQVQFPARPKVGIEHASAQAIISALAGRRRAHLGRKEFTNEDLVTFGMPVPTRRSQRAQWLRLLGCVLGFGAVYRKAELLHCLNAWCFSREEIMAAVEITRDEIYQPFLMQR